MTQLLHIVGCCERRLFGLTPAERLRRQRGTEPGPLLVARADTILGDDALAWLLENPGIVLTTPSGRAAAVAVPDEDEAKGVGALEQRGDTTVMNPANMPDMFIRKLRRRSKLLVRSVDEQPLARLERRLFSSVYKGVTDVITKFVWPLPAYWATKACAAARIPPNAVTLVGIASMLVAAFLWLQGEIALGLAFAWLMTFLDTVDGKLARVTVTSSRLGNKLDHLTDMLHPPLWWICLAEGIGDIDSPRRMEDLALAATIMVITYIIGRAVEMRFKATIGYNAYLWRPFDSRFRLVIARRNTILVLLTLGVLLGAAFEAYVLAAVWSVVSVVIQLVRYLQAREALRQGDARSWLM